MFDVVAIFGRGRQQFVGSGSFHSHNEFLVTNEKLLWDYPRLQEKYHSVMFWSLVYSGTEQYLAI